MVLLSGQQGCADFRDRDGLLSVVDVLVLRDDSCCAVEFFKNNQRFTFQNGCVKCENQIDCAVRRSRRKDSLGCDRFPVAVCRIAFGDLVLQGSDQGILRSGYQVLIGYRIHNADRPGEEFPVFSLFSLMRAGPYLRKSNGLILIFQVLVLSDHFSAEAQFLKRNQ